MLPSEWRSTVCAICQTATRADEVYPASIDTAELTPGVFSARRMPDRRHYRWVRCRTCSLLRSDPVAVEDPRRLYEQSSFTYGDEAANLRRSYRRVLESHVPPERQRGRLLEIGSGNGFLLQEALSMGFTDVTGVEPSKEAISAADPSVRPHLVNDVMRSGLFPPRSFDVVCLMHVLDHLPDPLATLRVCHDVLTPGGVCVFVVHNERAFSAKLLRRFSPIVDVEHTYLYSRRTAAMLLGLAGFDVVRSNPMTNRYSLAYLLRLTPLPATWKVRALLRWVSSLQARAMTIPLGNIAVSGRKA